MNECFGNDHLELLAANAAICVEHRLNEHVLCVGSDDKKLDELQTQSD